MPDLAKPPASPLGAEGFARASRGLARCCGCSCGWAPKHAARPSASSAASPSGARPCPLGSGTARLPGCPASGAAVGAPARALPARRCARSPVGDVGADRETMRRMGTARASPASPASRHSSVSAASCDDASSGQLGSLGSLGAGAQLGAGTAGERLQASRPARGEASGCRGVARGERGECAESASSVGSRRPPSSSGPPALGSVVPERSLRLACSRTARVSGADPTRGEPPGSASCCTVDHVRDACGACLAPCAEAWRRDWLSGGAPQGRQRVRVL